jgi:hypothetical protein
VERQKRHMVVVGLMGYNEFEYLDDDVDVDARRLRLGKVRYDLSKDMIFGDDMRKN